MEENYTLAKWLNNEMTEKELAEFKASPDYAIYEKIKNTSAHLKTPPFDEEQLLSTILASKKEEKSVIKFASNWLYKVAAVLVITLGLTYFLISNPTQTQFAENGKQTTFLLPDNSEVVLNSGSEIEYKEKNWDENRMLQLSGEAYFRVAKGKTFEVNTNLGKVTVLGTQFNVKARDKRFDVICYEGKVKVSYLNQEIIIIKNQNVSFENGKQIKISEPTNIKPSWTTDEIEFNNDNFTAIIKEIERKYNVIITTKTIESNQLFTGKIPATNLNAALQIIASTYHLKATKQDEKVYILEDINAKK
jgi:transmembrane sensor